jgi:hypothetical protein
VVVGYFACTIKNGNRAEMKRRRTLSPPLAYAALCDAKDVLQCTNFCPKLPMHRVG